MTNLEIKLENIVMNQKLKLMEENISPELKAFGLKMLQENSQLFSSLIQENLQDVRDRLNAGYNNAKTYVHDHRGSFGLGTGALAGAGLAAAYMLNQSDDEPLAQVNPTAPVVSQTTTIQAVEKHLPNPHENHDIRTENKPQISNGEQHGTPIKQDTNPTIIKHIETVTSAPKEIGGHQVVDDRMYIQSGPNGIINQSSAQNTISDEEKQRLIQNAFNGFR